MNESESKNCSFFNRDERKEFEIELFVSRRKNQSSNSSSSLFEKHLFWAQIFISFPIQFLFLVVLFIQIFFLNSAFGNFENSSKKIDSQLFIMNCRAFFFTWILDFIHKTLAFLLEKCDKLYWKLIFIKIKFFLEVYFIKFQLKKRRLALPLMTKFFLWLFKFIFLIDEIILYSKIIRIKQEFHFIKKILQ